MMNKPTFWLTGLSCSGKTILAQATADFLRGQGHRVEVLDGRIVRDELGDFFGYSKDERLKVNRVLCVLARLLARHDIIPIVTAITPYQESRDYNRRELDPYLEIFVDCPMETCMTRDSQGLYRKAMRGDLPHFIGVDDPFEIPKSSELRISTASEPVEVSAARVCAFVSGILQRS